VREDRIRTVQVVDDSRIRDYIHSHIGDRNGGGQINAVCETERNESGELVYLQIDAVNSLDGVSDKSAVAVIDSIYGAEAGIALSVRLQECGRYRLQLDSIEVVETEVLIG
jgi:hypothetical protein